MRSCAEVFMTAERKCTFFIHATAYNTFMLAIEDSDNKCITIEIIQSQLDNIQTPEEVKEKLKMLKDAEKAKYVRDNGLNVRLSHIIQSYVDLLFSPKELVLYKSFHPDEKANEMILFSARFLESVVVMARHWFFITSFCIFVHEKKLDDCSDDSRVGVQEDTLALIRKKTHAGKDLFELTIRFSNVELLCAFGFFCHTNRPSITPFFGSSIQNLPKEIVESYGTVHSKDIFVPKKKRNTVCHDSSITKSVC
ncbi:hypothetical protein BD560DRAFT_386493 [Blakeslea trispora]|nr:hypothetical protein BD560DRAFT_386493 [Blakeslea trispora]